MKFKKFESEIHIQGEICFKKDYFTILLIIPRKIKK